MEIKFKSKLWKWHADGAWYFISLPPEYYEDIKQISQSVPKKGFGSVKVEAKIGNTTWATSIFPDSKTKTFLLPVKKEIRTKQSLRDQDLVEVYLRIKLS